MIKEIAPGSNRAVNYIDKFLLEQGKVCNAENLASFCIQIRVRGVTLSYRCSEFPLIDFSNTSVKPFSMSIIFSSTTLPYDHR